MNDVQTIEAPPVVAPPTVSTTALELVRSHVSSINAFEAGVAAIEDAFRGLVFDTTTAKGLREATQARARVRSPRYEIQRLQKDAKAPLNKLKASIDEQAEWFIARLEAIEAPIDAQIKAEEARKEAARAAEAARLAEIKQRIEVIRGWPAAAAGLPAVLLEQKVSSALEYTCTAELFGELVDEARTVLNASTVQLESMLTAKRQAERDAAELEQLRKEKAEREAERIERAKAQILAERKAREAAQEPARDERPAPDTDAAAEIRYAPGNGESATAAHRELTRPAAPAAHVNESRERVAVPRREAAGMVPPIVMPAPGEPADGLRVVVTFQKRRPTGPMCPDTLAMWWRNYALELERHFGVA